MSNFENNKRIVKNTIFLYLRMFLYMGISLYTSRVVLNTLGVVDFGIYNVVGGVVLMLSFLGQAMSLSTERFLAFELGKNDYIQFKRIFSMSINIHTIIAIVGFILAETIGLWFLNSKLNIPIERNIAANWVYQSSILIFMLSISRIPFNATIIAHEQMKFYTYTSMIEAILKLLIVFALVFLGFDKLKLYSLLTFIVSLIIWIFYYIYVGKNFPETKYLFFWDNRLFKTLMSYAGWNFFGFFVCITLEQGITILLNLFFGTVIIAARAIASQVIVNINGFVYNFQMALNPQIIKSYAGNNFSYMRKLIISGSKYSFFLLFFISLPLLLETETVLSWWLKNVPSYSAFFCRLVLINILIDSLSGTLVTGIQASGNIKKYQIIFGSLILIVAPLSYLFFKLGFPPEVAFYINILITGIILFARLWLIGGIISFSKKIFLEKVLLPVILVVLSSSILPLIVKHFILGEVSQFFMVGITSSLSILTSVFFIGLNNEEQLFVKEKINKTIVNFISKK